MHSSDFRSVQPYVKADQTSSAEIPVTLSVILYENVLCARDCTVADARKTWGFGAEDDQDCIRRFIGFANQQPGIRFSYLHGGLSILYRTLAFSKQLLRQGYRSTAFTGCLPAHSRPTDKTHLRQAMKCQRKQVVCVPRATPATDPRSSVPEVTHAPRASVLRTHAPIAAAVDSVDRREARTKERLPYRKTAAPVELKPRKTRQKSTQT
jgi:hypothetical protein